MHKKLEISPQQKVVILSDGHLTSTNYSQRRAEALKFVFNQADLVVLLGDLWDAYIDSFEAFLNSQWACLFPLLLEKACHYLEGNHDPLSESDQRRSQFSVWNGQGLVLNTIQGKMLLIHGHQLVASFDNGKEHFFLSRTAVGRRLVQLNLFKNALLSYLGGSSWQHWLNAGSYHQSITAHTRKQQTYDVVITGHSHGGGVFSKDKYANPGVTMGGSLQYLLLHGDQLQFVEEQY